MDIIFDMETQNPDDMLTLCFLGFHPEINLGAVLDFAIDFKKSYGALR